MKKHLSILFLALAAFTASYAQDTRIKWKQIAAGTQGQVAIVGTDGNGAWVTAPFTKWSDTVGILATLYDLGQVSKREVASGAFSGGTITLTKQDGTTVVFGLGGYYVPASEKAAINGVATLGADGKVPSSQLPAQTLNDIFVVNSQAAMLALTATQGDFSIRTDVGKTFVLQQAPATTLSNWVELPQASGVTSVNGNAGPNVTLTTDNISQGSTNKYFNDGLARAAVSATGPIQYNNSTGVFSHAASGVTAGTYNNVTVDASGHVTGASNTVYLTSSDLTNYYTKTELQTSGSAAVHWNNITSKPSNIASQQVRQQFTGGTSGVLTLSNTPLYPSAVLVFLNGVQLHTADYSISGTTLTLGFTRESSDIITAKYSY